MGSGLIAAAVYLNPGLTEAVISHCMESEGDGAKCYEREISRLYPKKDIEEIFEIVREVREKDPSYQFCHVLAHKLGELVVAEDPERWLDAVSLNPPDGMCSNGFIHGVIGGRFRAEVLDDETIEKFTPDFRKACEPRENWKPSDLDRAICYHGMGHLFVFITDADLPKALAACESVAPSSMRRVCIEGVFMQVYQPLEPDDFELLKRLPSIPTVETYRAFCASFARDEYVGACLREAWPLFRKEVVSGVGVETFCSEQPNIFEESKCHDTTSSIIGRMTLERPEEAARACSSVPEARRAQCFEAVARAILEENREASQDAVAFCEMAEESTVRKCLERLIQTSHFMFGSNLTQKRRFCAEIPERLRSSCEESLRTSL